MLHLVLAKGKYCEKNMIIRSGNYEELSGYTTKFNNSDEIREKNKSFVKKFMDLNGVNGDVVIMNDEFKNQRVRVLYKKHILVANEILKSQRFIQHIVSNNILLVSEWDYRVIMYYKYSKYLKHMKNFLKRRTNYYATIRHIIKAYEKYQKAHDLPSVDAMYKEILNKKNMEAKKRLEKKCLSSDLDCDMKNENFYENINDSLNSGGYEEVFNYYSLDDLDCSLYEGDFKKLVKSDYHR